MHRRAAYSEKWLELRLAEALTRHGLRNFHMSSPALPGIPDRYVVGANGLWIEVKQGKSIADLIRGFDRQRTFLTALHRGGDAACVCALWQPPQGSYLPRLFLEPWQRWLLRERAAGQGRRWDQYDSIYRSPAPMDKPDDLNELFAYFSNIASNLNA
jgi:hypothetical protein